MSSAEESSSSDERDEEEEEEEESEEEEEEEDEDSEDEGKGRKRKGKGNASKRKKRKVRSLFEEEADVDDDEESEEEEERGYKAPRGFDSVENQRIQERYDRRREENLKFMNTSEEEIAKKYMAEEESDEDDGFHPVPDVELVSRNAFLPTVSDPKLFCVKCKPGEEMMLCIQLMNKYRNLYNQPSQPKIYSAVASGTKGFIYIEANNQQHVMDALYGIRGVFRSKVTLVPLKEMTVVLRVISKKQVVKPGDFVRLRRFPYKGDLAKVVDVVEGNGKIVVQYVPRIDFTMFKDMTQEQKKEHRAKKIIPPKRFFNIEEIEKAELNVSQRLAPWNEGMQVYEFDNEFFDNGYAFKELGEALIQVKDVRPTLEELQAFRHGGRTADGEDDDDMEGKLKDGSLLEEIGNAALPSKASRKGTIGPSFKKGDVVVVKEGELQHLKGEVVGMDINGMVKINPLDEVVRGTILDFPASDLMKIFDIGDHVKVLNGAYAGDTGSIVKIMEDTEKWRAIIFTDSSAKEVVVFLDDLQISAEVAQSLDSLKGYNLNDLVSLGTQVGVIVKIRRDNLDVLLQTGTIRTATVQEIRAKLNNKSKNTTAMDKNRNVIQENSVIRVIAGENAGIEGTVKHIFRSFLFVHSKMRVENSGVFVERVRNVQLAGIKLRNVGGFGVHQQGAGGGKSFSGRGGRGGGPGAAGRGRGGPNAQKDTLVGKTVQVRSGRFKGYTGIVVSATEEMVKVEIHSKKKMVDIRREKVVVVGDRNGRSDGSIGISNNAPGYSSNIPNNTIERPSTPLNAPGTPGGSHDTSGVDPWNPNAGGGTPVPTTPGADDTWNTASERRSNYQPPPTPAAYGSSSTFAGAQTPAAVIPQTPATPAVPATPGAGILTGDSDDLVTGGRYRIVSGKLAGKYCDLEGTDGSDAIIRMDGSILVVSKDTITRA